MWIIFKILLQCNFLFFILQFVFNLLIPDHEAEAFRTIAEDTVGWLDTVVRNLLIGFSRWDSQHFLQISIFGYTFENNLAFFPLFPFLLRNFGWLIYYLAFCKISFYTCLLFGGFLMNFLLFCISGFILYHVTLIKFPGDQKFALICIYLFSANPASIFFHTLYSESLFCFLTFLGLLFLHKKSFLNATLSFALSSLVRSNGIINFGHVIFAFISPLLVDLYTKIRHNDIKSRDFLKINRLDLRNFAKNTLILALFGLIMFLPFIILQFYQRLVYCNKNLGHVFDEKILEMAQNKGYILLYNSSNLIWCSSGYNDIPYNFVQKRYWSVAFLGYYRLRKIPNFILALPTLILAILACRYFLFEENNPKNELKLRTAHLLRANSFLPYVCHVTFLSLFGLLFINVEVVTRILFSSSPLLIWYSAKILMAQKNLHKCDNFIKKGDLIKFYCNVWKICDLNGKIVISYFLLYAIVGTMLHCNFLPWT